MKIDSLVNLLIDISSPENLLRHCSVVHNSVITSTFTDISSNSAYKSWRVVQPKFLVLIGFHFFRFWINIQDALVTAYSCYIVLTRLTRYSFFSWNMKQDEFTRLNEQVRYGMVQHGQRLRFVYVLLRFEDIELLF